MKKTHPVVGNVGVCTSFNEKRHDFRVIPHCSSPERCLILHRTYQHTKTEILAVLIEQKKNQNGKKKGGRFPQKKSDKTNGEVGKQEMLA